MRNSGTTRWDFCSLPKRISVPVRESATKCIVRLKPDMSRARPFKPACSRGFEPRSITELRRQVRFKVIIPPAWTLSNQRGRSVPVRESATKCIDQIFRAHSPLHAGEGLGVRSRGLSPSQTASMEKLVGSYSSAINSNLIPTVNLLTNLASSEDLVENLVLLKSLHQKA
jgi:hypothetical protein